MHTVFKYFFLLYALFCFTLRWCTEISDIYILQRNNGFTNSRLPYHTYVFHYSERERKKCDIVCISELDKYVTFYWYNWKHSTLSNHFQFIFRFLFCLLFFLHRKSINVNWFLFFFFLSLLFHYTSINTDRIDEMLQRFPIEYCLVCVICFFFPCFGVYDVSNIVSITSVAFHFKTQKPLSPSPTVFFSSSLVSHFLWAMEWPLF